MERRGRGQGGPLGRRRGRGLHRGGGHDPGRPAGRVLARPHGRGGAGGARGGGGRAARRHGRLRDEPRGIRRRGKLRFALGHLPRALARPEPPRRDGDLVGRRRALHGVRGRRRGPPPDRAGGRWGEDDAPPDAAGVRADRPLHRSVRALVRGDDARAGRPRHARVDDEDRRHSPGYLGGRRQEPRERGEEPARPFPGDGEPRDRAREPARGGPAAPLPLLPDLRRRGGRRRPRRAGARPRRRDRPGHGLPRPPLPRCLHGVPRDPPGSPRGLPDGRASVPSASASPSFTMPSRRSS